MHIVSANKRTTAGIAAFIAVGFFGFVLAASAQTYGSNNNDSNGGSIYDTDLSGGNEVPSVNSGVTGHAGVWIDDNNNDISFWLDVFDGDDVIAAHLHCAPEGENGPVVVGLFEDDGGVDINGRLASGDIDEGDIEGTGEDCDDTIGYEITDLNDLINAIEDGDIYVNVHNEDYPAGAARGQLEYSDDNNGNNDNGSGHGKGDGHDKNPDKDRSNGHDDKNKDSRKGDKDDRKPHYDKDMNDRNKDDSRRDSDKNDRYSNNGRDGKDGKDGKNGNGSSSKDDSDDKEDSSKSDNDRSNSNARFDVKGTLENIKARVFGGLDL